ncbi:GFA family protein [Pelagibius litoralis]|uniref:GFA family protein n=1 Tax=Pelagibius litoralis TaxID=374515 RepID=A0A967EXC9_9PROT|nr:GFA family protein [Pelagibius litoralis]NIA68900.1 GFA family protein [Pelagibius litoralis]
MTLSGGCLCGAVRFEIRGGLSDAHACHCRLCRRQSGHFAVASDAERADFTLTETRGLTWYRSSEIAQRGFCRDCGSVLFWDDGGEAVSINLGSLDGPSGVTLTKHIFVDQKGDYYTIADGLPQFEGYDRPVEPD